MNITLTPQKVVLWEPVGAFPYSPPGEATREKYGCYIDRVDPIPRRAFKEFLDKFLAGICLLLTSPIFLCLYLANWIEGHLIPKNRGSLIFSYNAMSRGKVFPKYKIRLIAQGYIDPEGARKGDWHAYIGEWSPTCRTYTGSFAKKFYLDELPQLFNIWRGEMSFVGPRPLACHHYERDIQQGNVFRKFLTGGLLGPSQCLKGTNRFGNSDIEFEYLDKFATLKTLPLLWYDLHLIWRGLMVVCQGKGL